MAGPMAASMAWRAAVTSTQVSAVDDGPPRSAIASVKRAAASSDRSASRSSTRPTNDSPKPMIARSSVTVYWIEIAPGTGIIGSGVALPPCQRIVVTVCDPTSDSSTVTPLSGSSPARVANDASCDRRRSAASTSLGTRSRPPYGSPSSTPIATAPSSIQLTRSSRSAPSAASMVAICSWASGVAAIASFIGSMSAVNDAPRLPASL